MKPFRWNVGKVEQLGKLVDPDAPLPNSAWVTTVAETAAKIVARSNNRDLVFVGRSPENFFDYLSGVFAGTSRERRILHLNFSNRGRPIAEIRAANPEAYAGLCDHVKALGLHPAGIVASSHGVCFVDLVYEGGTFGHLFTFLCDWAAETGLDANHLVDNTSFVGVTIRTKTSPNTWRWQQQVDWVKRYNITQIKNVSLPYRSWSELGDTQAKVTPSNHQKRWAADSMIGPNRSEATIGALQLAHGLYRAGTEQQREFARLLNQTEAVKLPWFRELMAELR